MRYSSNMETTLNSSMAKAYSVQRISWSSSTPVTRYSRRSTGRNTGSMNVRSRLNTRVRNTPMGLVTARIRARNTMIWNHPLAVMSELLRSQQCVEEVNHHQPANDDHDGRLDVHRSPHLTRSQKWTYPNDKAKNAIVIATNIRSCMFKLLRGRALPSSLFAAKPPDHSDSGGVLVLGENALRAGEEDRYIGPVAPVFVFHLKSIRQREVVGCRDFFQRLGDSTE